MSPTSKRYFEIESIEELERHLRQHGNLQHVVLQELDLTRAAIEQALMGMPAADAFLLGCTMSQQLLEHLVASGAAIFPRLGFPFRAYRRSLYSREELMQGYRHSDRSSLAQTLDGRIYDFFSRHRQPEQQVPIIMALGFRLHDHSIDDALYDLLYPDDGKPRRVVGVMGGHGMSRAAPSYLSIARITQKLSRAGYFIASGGGPGAMEAANLGSYLAACSDAELVAAVDHLATQPGFDDETYLEVAYQILDRHPQGNPSLAIPTWFYGHEPTNMFSTHIAKYFDNSIREEGLLAIARHGVIYAPGSAGTIQEIFMDTTQNHYVTHGAISPMVFLGTEFWTEERPVMPLLERLAGDRPYRQMITTCDSVGEAVEFIEGHPPAVVATA